MSQQPEHDVVFVRPVDFHRIELMARVTAIADAFKMTMEEAIKGNMCLVQHSVITMPDCNGVILVVHCRKIDDFNDEARGHVLERAPYSRDWYCTRCKLEGLKPSDAGMRCLG